jgi:hypothetical protein
MLRMIWRIRNSDGFRDFQRTRKRYEDPQRLQYSSIPLEMVDLDCKVCLVCELSVSE